MAWNIPLVYPPLPQFLPPPEAPYNSKKNTYLFSETQLRVKKNWVTHPENDMYGIYNDPFIYEDNICYSLIIDEYIN